MIIELFGWIGAIILLIAYISNIMSKLANDSVTFLVLNIVGASLLIVNAYYNGVYPFLIINLFWLLVSIFQLGKGLSGASKKS